MDIKTTENGRKRGIIQADVSGDEGTPQATLAADAEMPEDIEDKQGDRQMDNGGPGDTPPTPNHDDGLPIDRGWAWVILFACFFEMFILGGMMRSFGVFFIQFQQRFNSSAAETSIMNLIQNIVISVTALLVMTLGLQKFSSRTAVFIGGILHVASYLITAFSWDIGVLYFAFGIIGGIGNALTMPPIMAILGVYFKKHRGLANSIFASGGSVGGFIFSPIIIKLFDEFGFSGAMLIIAGILGNILVSAVLLRPLEFYTKHKPVSKNDIREENFDEEKEPLKMSEIKESLQVDIQSDIFPDKELAVLQKMQTDKVNHSFASSQLLRMHSYEPARVKHMGQCSPLVRRARTTSFEGKRQRTVSETVGQVVSNEHINSSKSKLAMAIDAVTKSQLALYTSAEGLCGSFVQLNIPCENLPESSDGENDHLDDPGQLPKSSCCSMVRKSIVSVICEVFDINLLKKPIFILFLSMAFCVISGVALVPVFIPPHCKDIGLSGTQIGMLLSIQAVIDLVAKVTMGVVADRQWLKRSTILAASVIMLGTACHLLRFSHNFYTMLAFQIISGISCGQYLSIYAVLLMETIGPVNFKKSLGFGTLVHGVSIAVVFPLGGLLRDATGGYIATFHLIGGFAYIGAVILLLVEWVHKRQQTAD